MSWCRITFLRVGLIWSIGGLAVGQAEARPNVLFIAIDDLRPSLGAYGADGVKSPNLDSLSAGAVVFDNAFCQVPVCGASRASLLTGLLPTRERFRDFESWAEKDAPGAVTLPGAFKAAGYTVVSNGKIFHNRDDSTDAFSERPWRPKISHAAMLDPESEGFVGGARNRGPFFESADVEDDAYHDGQVLDRSLQDLRRLAKSGRPFMLMTGFIRPHLPFYAPSQDWERYEPSGVATADFRELPSRAPQGLKGSTEIQFYADRGVAYNSEDWHRVARRGYFACISYVDRLVGRLLEEVKALGLEDDTIVVVWGDHGFLLGEHDLWGKLVLLPEALRIPLIIRVPGERAGRESEVVEAVDIFPTLCGLAGIEAPAGLPGRTLFGEHGEREFAYSRMFEGDALISPDWLYARYAKGARVEELLLDRNGDPEGRNNVADDPANSVLLGNLRAQLATRIAGAEGVGE